MGRSLKKDLSVDEHLMKKKLKLKQNDEKEK